MEGARLHDVCERHERPVLALGVAVGLALRVALAFSPHSGLGKPPLHGDFEAQRHWMEITTALPVAQWYENSTDNDLLYWGLDYPPLTAYHSQLLGTAGHRLAPDCFRLHSSRGQEAPHCRAFMRASVVISDIVVLLPGVICAVRGFSAEGEHAAVRVGFILLLWCLPPLMLIDHGHFQYNGVCFGLCLAAAGWVAEGRTLAASVLFTAGLLFKQIALYYAPAFFAAILAQCLRRQGALLHVAITGGVVLGTTATLFVPWLSSRAALGQVLHRMFPFARGLYEDKVANVWCSISVVVKLQKLLPPRRLPLFCAVVTLAALTPACACCCLRGGKLRFVVALAASAFAFFLFAFQVHEKSVLFPCIAVCLLPVALGPSRRPQWAAAALFHFLLVCLFSMYPLVVKDNLQVAYVALCIPLLALCEASPASPLLRAVFRGSWAAACAIHAVHALVPAPAKYPDIWTLLITGPSCAYFLLCWGGLTLAQIREPSLALKEE